MLFRLFGPRLRKNQEDIAGRAAEVIVHVLFDAGLDREFRPRLYAVAPQAFRAQVRDAGIDAPLLATHARMMADSVLRG